jgi:hypothetical protein
VFTSLRTAKYAAVMRRFRKVVWAVFVAVAAAEIIAVVLPVPFGLALTIALFVLAVSVTVVDGIVSGDFAFLLGVARYKLRSGGFGLNGSFGAVVLNTGPLGERALMFTTNTEPKRIVTTDRRPVGIRFIKPVEQEVSLSKLPSRVKKAGLTILCVDQFEEEGIVITMQRPGVDIRAEVSYDRSTGP